MPNIISFILCFLCLLSLGFVNGLMFHLGPNMKKCLTEEIHKDVLVMGEYEISEAPGQKTDLVVTDSKAQILVNREDTHSGKFVFTTDDYDVFEVCFVSHVPHPQASHGRLHEVSLKMKHGVEAKSYEGLAETSKLKPLEVELKRLEDLSEAIVQDFAYMRKREEEMRDTNESTNSRVLYFSVFSMLCLLGLASWQVLYLRRYFKSKKLIE